MAIPFPPVCGSGFSFSFRIIHETPYSQYLDPSIVVNFTHVQSEVVSEATASDAHEAAPEHAAER